MIIDEGHESLQNGEPEATKGGIDSISTFSNPSNKPTVRGRARSTSISEGSPSPSAIWENPSKNPISSSGYENGKSNSGGNDSLGASQNSFIKVIGFDGPQKGHRVSLSVPGILSPQPISAKVGRHRRNASVSPPGFPVISEGDVTGFEPSKLDSTFPRAIPMVIKPLTNGLNSNGPSPTNHLPKYPSPSNSASPNSQLLSHNFASHHANSHAALLSGVRSHALPHSPTHIDSARNQESFDSSNNWVHSIPNSTLLSNPASPASPPFGPTPTSNHHPPSPLALEFQRASPVGIGGFPESGLFDSKRPQHFEPDERISGPLDDRPKSPTLPPVFLETPATQGRRRAGSFTRSEEADSPSSLYLAEAQTSPFGQCDIRDAPFIHTSPSSPPLFPTPLPITSTSPLTRPRSRSFTSDRNFAPLLLNEPPPSPINPSPTTIPFESPPSPAFEEFSPTMELLHSIPNDLEIFPPPPSPHRSAIALPPQQPAAAPIPPHLGGPSLPRPPGRTARAIASNLALSQKLNAVAGTEHLPRNHSPLASPALLGEQEDPTTKLAVEQELIKGTVIESKVTVEDELLEAETSPMHLTISTNVEISVDAGSPASPASPDPQQLDAYLALQPELTLALSPRRGETPILPKSGWDEDDSDELVVEEIITESESVYLSGSHSDYEVIVQNEPNGLLLLSSATDFSLGATQGVVTGFNDSNRTHLVNMIETLEEGNNSPFNAFGLMDVDGPASTLGSNPSAMIRGDVTSVGMVRSTEVADVSIEEEKLSPLERIFICAKSEHAEERARVSHNLGEWLLQVDICDAVEYVLPLLPELATDAEDIVKEVLSPQLDLIMWHFFSQCSLLEINSNGDSHHSTPFPSPSIHSRSESQSTQNILPPSMTSNFFSPTTPKTSTSTNEFAEVPAISATTFTSLLGALLTDQSSLVAKSTQASLVRFLCRLKGKPLILDGIRQTPPHETIPGNSEPHSHQHLPYTISIEACRVLEDEFVTGIVLGLARLDDDGELSMDGIESERSVTIATQEINPTQLVLSPEEENFEDPIGDSWLAAATEDDGKIVDDWGTYHSPTTKPIDFTHLPISSPNNFEVQSAFSPDIQCDEESAIGKMVSMGLIGAIATADCLEPEVLVHHILPEVDRMKSEPMFYVRKEAVQALGSLARTLPLDVFESVVLPLHASFARDNLWHVRRAACLALPAICKRLPYHLLRSQVISNIQFFAADASRNVRSGALEVCGELIFLFKDDPNGVPLEVIQFFLGRVPTVTPSATPLENPLDNPFSPLQNALDSPSAGAFFDGPPSWLPTSNLISQTLPRDPDRPVMCAFNIPAVVLTLGREKWPILSQFYSELSCDKTDKVRQSLASSLHEIAQIIGPDHSDQHLLVPFSNFLRDYEHIQSAVLEHVALLLSCFGMEAGRTALGLLTEAWTEIRNWRMREKLTKDLCEFGQRYIGFEGEEILRLMAAAFKDPVAAVRNQAVHSVPITFEATREDPIARTRLFAFLNVFSEDSSYKNRAIYTSTVMAFVQHGISRSTFDTYFLDTLSRLAADKVLSIKIGVSKVMEAICGFAHLYADIHTRQPIHEILSVLAHSTARDVKLPILHYYIDSFTCARSAPPIAIIIADEEMSEIALNDFSTGEIIALESNKVMAGDEDVEMGEDGVLLEAPSPILWTKDLELENGFVEVRGFS